MDGTIIDTEPAWVRAETDLLEKYGAKLQPSDLTDWVGIGLWELAEIFIDRGVDLGPDEIVVALSNTVSHELDSGEINWRPGARELIAEFVELGIPNALVTMATRKQALHIISALPDNSFQTVTAGDDVTKPKPHPDPYLIGAKSLGVSARDCVAIEDSVTGVSAAAAAETFVIAVPNLVNLNNSPYSVKLDSLAGICANDIVDMFNNNNS